MRNTARLIAGLLLFAVSGIFAQEAVLKELSGTVELKQTGSAVWETAVQGQAMSVDTVISTGFKSIAVISIGNSFINVRPLTRLSIRELSTRTGVETINISLQAGRVRAEVNPPAGSRAVFNIQTPTTTASVRGTIFELDTVELRVIEGVVAFSGTSGTAVVVDAGGDSYIDERTGRTAPPMETLQTTLKPELPVGSDLTNTFKGADTAVQNKNSFELFTLIDYK